METIDLSLYVKSGEGANGSSYDMKGNPEIMLKLYNEDYPLQPVIEEQAIARKVYDLGIPSPEPGELVTDGKRTGIRFKRIVGKRSYSRALADEPQRVEEYAREFARNCRFLHSTKCPEGLFPSLKEQYITLLEADKTFTPEEQAIIRREIESMPDCNTAVHGDLHIGNILTTLPVGAPISAPHDIYFIDLGYFAYGCPLLDIGMLMNICLYADEEFRVHDMHVGYDVTSKFWDYFVDEYFFGEDKLGEKWFGPGATPQTVNEGMQKYVSIKMLLVEFNLGFMPENYITFIRKWLDSLK